MLKTVRDGGKCFAYLFSFKNYRTREIWIKSVGIGLVLPLFIILFVAVLFLYLIEQISAPIFKLFVYTQIKFIKARNYASPWKTRAIGVMNLLFTLVFLPFVVIYYLAMLLKLLFKYWLKAIIIKLDFTAEFEMSTLMIFDDAVRKEKSGFSQAMKANPESQALNKALQSYFTDVIDEETSSSEEHH